MTVSFQRAKLKKLIDQVPEENLNLARMLLMRCIDANYDPMTEIEDPDELVEVVSYSVLDGLDIRNKFKK